MDRDVGRPVPPEYLCLALDRFSDLLRSIPWGRRIKLHNGMCCPLRETPYVDQDRLMLNKDEPDFVQKIVRNPLEAQNVAVFRAFWVA